MVSGDCETRKMALVDLRPADYNPRKISQKAFDGLGASIEKFGMLEPIVWNERTGSIVGGHQRYRHLVETGETETDVVVVDLSDQEEVALNIALNSREVRGDFTDEVADALRVCEARLGNAFKDLRLQELFDSLDVKPPKSRGEGGGGGGTPPPSEDAQPVVRCPECGSKWTMRDRKVIHNAVVGGDDGSQDMGN